MVTTAPISPATASPEPASAYSEAISFVYVGIWQCVFWFRVTVVGAILPPFLLFLFAIELLGPLLHVIPGFEQLHMLGRILVAAPLLGCAGLLTYHHHRLTFRINRHEVVLSSIRKLVQADGHIPSLPPRIQVCRVLDALTFALGYHVREFRFATTVLVGTATGKRLKLLAQDSQSTFEADLELDLRDSAAGLIAGDSSDTVLYVPKTQYIHGVKLAFSQTYPEKSFFRSMSIVAGAFHRLGGQGQVCVQSLLCVKIPIEGPDAIAILNITADKANSMGYLEFSAAQVAAALLSKAVGEVLAAERQAKFKVTF